jgi:hypothetical protein
MQEPEIIVIDDPVKETTGAKLKRLAEEARATTVGRMTARGKMDVVGVVDDPNRSQRRERGGRHRVQASGDGVGSLVGGTGQIVKRRGYSSYSATKPQPWDVKNENRKKAKKAKASRKANR